MMFLLGFFIGIVVGAGGILLLLAWFINQPDEVPAEEIRTMQQFVEQAQKEINQ